MSLFKISIISVLIRTVVPNLNHTLIPMPHLDSDYFPLGTINKKSPKNYKYHSILFIKIMKDFQKLYSIVHKCNQHGIFGPFFYH